MRGNLHVGGEFLVEAVRREAERDEGVEEDDGEAVPRVLYGTKCNTWRVCTSSIYGPFFALMRAVLTCR